MGHRLCRREIENEEDAVNLTPEDALIATEPLERAALSTLVSLPMPAGDSSDMVPDVARFRPPKRALIDCLRFDRLRSRQFRGVPASRPAASGGPTEPAAGNLERGRALFRWSAEDLARHSALGVTTIRRAELANDETSMTAANDQAVRRALEAAGVEFIDENGGGPGVRLKRHQTKS